MGDAERTECEWGVQAEHDTGRSVTRLGVDWPIVHVLSRHPFGWVVSREVCRGDLALERRDYYDTQDDAMVAWCALVAADLGHDVAISDPV